MSIPESGDDPVVTLKEAAQLTGWHLGTLRDYFVRGIFEWAKDDARAKTAGSKSLLSLRGLVRLAVAHELWKLGVAPRKAFKAAYAFADFGSSPSLNPHKIGRLAGGLFPEGYETILIWDPETGARVIPIPTKSREGPLEIFLPQNDQAGLIVLRIDLVVERLMRDFQKSKNWPNL